MIKKFSMAAIAAAMSMSLLFGGVGSLTAHAEELTQIQNPEDVNYGNYGADFSAEDIALLESMFDADYYAFSNPDVVAIIKAQLGDNYSEEAAKALLFKHFQTCGMFEGRSLSADFNVMAFATAYEDLRNAFGTDLLSYYKYAATHDLAAEGRTITTVEAAAKAGITVQSITNPDVQITPQLYYLCEELGIKDLQTVNDYVKAIVPVASSSSSGSSSSSSGSATSTATNTNADNKADTNGNTDTSSNSASSGSEESSSATDNTGTNTSEDTSSSASKQASVAVQIKPVTVSGYEVDQYDSLVLDADKAKELIKAYSIGTLDCNGDSIKIYEFEDANGNKAFYKSTDTSADPIIVSTNFNSSTIGSNYTEHEYYAYYDDEEGKYHSMAHNQKKYNSSGEVTKSSESNGGGGSIGDWTKDDYINKLTDTIGVVFLVQNGVEYLFTGNITEGQDAGTTTSWSNYKTKVVDETAAAAASEATTDTTDTDTSTTTQETTETTDTPDTSVTTPETTGTQTTDQSTPEQTTPEQTPAGNGGTDQSAGTQGTDTTTDPEQDPDTPADGE